MLECKRGTIWVALALLGLLLVCYGNSFQGSWQYDDINSIVKNTDIHIEKWNWENLVGVFNSGPSHQLISRPLAYLSFAFNYSLGQLDVFGYHLVNFAIHWLNSLLLFLFIRDTLTLPILGGRYHGRASLIACAASVLWACHPIQVTAVTYVVQRMTSMAGLFYLLALYSYLIGRRTNKGKVRWTAYLICSVSSVCALLTKENSILLFYSLLIFDLLFFQEINKRSVGRTAIVGIGVTVILCGVSLLFLNANDLLKPYSNRPFTMVERVLTQPRVLFIYLSLIALPLNSRMSILHDVTVSHNLLTPWTTLPAILGLAFCVGLLCFLVRKNRILAYSGIFYLLNQSVESSFLNLELIYEHRNYVPSMLIFLPVAIVWVRSLDFFYYKTSFQAAISLSMAIWFLSAVHTTWGYNKIFKSEYTLWAHTSALYPRLSLPYVNAGKVFWHAGDKALSYQLNLKGIELDNFNNLHQKGIAYYNLGLYASEELNELEKAQTYFQKAKKYFRAYPPIWQELAKVQINLGYYRMAKVVLTDGMAIWPNNIALMGLKALNELKMRRYESAFAIAERIIHSNADNNNLMIMVAAESCRLLGDNQTARNYWHQLLFKDKQNIAALMALIEISHRTENTADLNAYVHKLLEIKALRGVISGFDLKIGNENFMPYVPNTRLIKETLKKYSLLEGTFIE